MRHLALDVGDKRVGVALSDEGERLARPLEVIARRPGPGGFQRLAALVAEAHVGCIVVGLPLLPDGSEGQQVRSTRAYVRGLLNYVNVPVVYYDERGSSAQARDILLASGARRGRRQRPNDAVAAAVTLQTYLDEKLTNYEHTTTCTPQPCAARGGAQGQPDSQSAADAGDPSGR